MNRPPRPRGGVRRRRRRVFLAILDLLVAALRDRLERRRPETADLRDRIFLRLRLPRLAFDMTAAPPAPVVVRNGFRLCRRRLPRPRLPARRARTACMTPPHRLTSRCQAVRRRRLRPRRVFRPGLSVAMRKPGIISSSSRFQVESLLFLEWKTSRSNKDVSSQLSCRPRPLLSNRSY